MHIILLLGALAARKDPDRIRGRSAGRELDRLGRELDRIMHEVANPCF